VEFSCRENTEINSEKSQIESLLNSLKNQLEGDADSCVKIIKDIIDSKVSLEGENLTNFLLLLRVFLEKVENEGINSIIIINNRETKYFTI
jgi:hypothetical protein